MPVASLRRELWGRRDSPSMLAHYEEKNFKNIKIGKWERVDKSGDSNRRGYQWRFARCFVLAPWVFRHRSDDGFENQHIEADQDVRGGFVVHCSAQAPSVAYGKSVITRNQFVFEWVAPRQTRVRISCQVDFSKKGAPPGFICSQIRNGSKKGAKESSELLIDMLSSSGTSAAKRKRKKRQVNELIRWIPQIIAIVVMAAALLSAWLLRQQK